MIETPACAEVVVNHPTPEALMYSLLLSSAFAAAPVWFGAPVAITGPADYASDVKTGDFNGDGTLDVSVSTGDMNGWTTADRPFTLELSLSDGSGGYTAVSVATSMLSGYTLVTDAGDLDGDGYADLVAGHVAGFSVFFSDGTTLATTVDYPGARVGPVELGDVDADGDLDLLTVDNAGDLNLYTNDGSGAFTLVQALPVGSGDVMDHQWDSIDLIDLDGDGAADVVVNVAEAYFTATVPLHVYLGDGAGQFDPTAWTSATAGGYDIGDLAVGDIDGNGSIDLVYPSAWGGEVASIEWSGGFGATSTWPLTSYGYTWIVAGDIDGDGDSDMVGSEGFEVGVLLQDGGGLVDQGTYTIAATTGWAVANDGIELVDMDGDGCADLVLALFGVGTSIMSATGPGCGAGSPDTGDTGDSGTDDTGDTGAPPPSASLCAVNTPQAGSVALLALAGLALVRRRR